MPEPLTQYNQDIWAAYNAVSTAMNNWRNEFYNLGDQINAQNWAAARQSCYDLGNDFSTYFRALLCDSSGVKGKVYQSLHWIDDNWPSNGPAEITMDAILTAIYDSDKLRWFHFINYIDSMRAGIWNTEIFDTHLAEWYRHFSL